MTLDLERCPKGCGRHTQPQRGHPTLCLPCTEAELGETLPKLRARVNELLTKGRKRNWSLFTDTGSRRWTKHQHLTDPDDE